MPALPSAGCGQMRLVRSVGTLDSRFVGVGRVMVRGRFCLVLTVRGCGSILPSWLDPVPVVVAAVSPDPVSGKTRSSWLDPVCATCEGCLVDQAVQLAVCAAVVRGWRVRRVPAVRMFGDFPEHSVGRTAGRRSGVTRDG